MPAPMKLTSLYLPADVLRRLQQTAKRRGVSQGELVREALAQYPGLTPKRRRTAR